MVSELITGRCHGLLALLEKKSVALTQPAQLMPRCLVSAETRPN
jgi:hypothetical protein